MCVCVWLVQEKRYEEACAKFNTVLQVMGYRGGMCTIHYNGTVCHLAYLPPSLASQPYFSSCACALGRGAGEGKEKYVW